MWWEVVRNFFFPPFCVSCEGATASPGEVICRRCWAAARAERAEPFTLTPAGLVEGAAADGIYGRCAYRWNERFEPILHAYKYRGFSQLDGPLGEALAALIVSDRRLASCDLLLPVPLTVGRRRERGYNQAERIARKAAAPLGAKVSSGAVRRRGGLRSQTKLGRSGRRANVSGVFRVKHPSVIAGRKILVVDDVITTGATAGELARVLLAAGAVRVAVAAVVQAGSSRRPS